MEADDELDAGVQTDFIDNYQSVMVGPQALFRTSWPSFTKPISANVCSATTRRFREIWKHANYLVMASLIE